MAILTRPLLSAPSGTAEYYWLPAVADAGLTPTRPEITAGDNITAAVNAIAGGDSAPQYEDFDLHDNATAAKVFVGANLNDLSMTFGYSTDGAADTDIYDILAEGDSGYLLVCPGGDVAGYAAWVYRCAVSVMSDVIASRQVTRTNVAFSVTERQRVVLPAAA